MAALASADPDVRAEARQRLVEQGSPAVPDLVKALSDPATHVRWEAAKALAEIADPASVPGLVASLEDRDQAVRWLAAEGLIRIGRPGLRCLLEALRERAGSMPLRQGAHHIVHDLLAEDRLSFLRPVDQALQNATTSVTASVDAALAGLLAESN
jgi:HEAT repeat protein